MTRSDNAAPEIVHSVCPHDCPSTCALDVERLDARTIGRVRGAPDNNYTAGVVCAKVARYAERVHHVDRLAHPLRRTGPKGSGAFTRISWDEALDEVAQAISGAVEKYDSETVWPYFYAGTMGLLQRDGIERLRHVCKFSRQRSTICTTLADAGWLAGVGQIMGPDPREIAETDLIVCWGGNPAATQVNLMSHITTARKSRGAKLVVIDPYRGATAAVADRHLCLRPGTDGALACAMMHVLFAEGWADRDYMARYTDCPDDLETHLQSRSPAWAAAITGLEESEITDFARQYGAAERSYIRLGYGFSRSRNGAAQFHAVTCLPSVTGAWLQVGGGAFYANRVIYGWDKTLIEGLDALDPAIRRLDMSRIGPILTGDPHDLGDGPPVTAMLIQNTNPMAVAPESVKVRDGFLRDDLFVCVHEQFMTDTARMADIVLPATSFLEHDDIYQAGGHGHVQIGPQVIEPYAEARSNHAVICALAARLGAEHRGFTMSAWEIIDETLRASNKPGADELRERRWVDCQPDFDHSHFIDGFPTKDGRFHFAPDWAAIGRDHEKMPKLPDHMAAIEAADDEHPYRLVTAPSRNFLNSTFTETPTSIARERRPTVMIHPDDMASLGLDDGDRVRVGNRRGDIVVHTSRFADMQRGVVIIESVWPNGAYEEGMGVNALIGADAAPPLGGAGFHDAAVWRRAVRASPP
ncbi:MAG: molybdopterin oxidoreductase family protein, partial [Proteobacteria bacterium]|nr:molybdopterin oxidoreductase family protein [Pseudomonadota bacterium]